MVLHLPYEMSFLPPNAPNMAPMEDMLEVREK
eukprot:CAMPEP_0116883108 /NCGR_PEP_ID=MMETSP0463-20121206/15548_1 /TAXON_ID=181622 /ORGANISM="Strombidinopsis sp, Strain SopsisLIS2011" /LENGTH=31 /DNA_ID= /DNA_START= /DNA_END= /DNA_ORIENTATION=